MEFVSKTFVTVTFADKLDFVEVYLFAFAVPESIEAWARTSVASNQSTWTCGTKLRWQYVNATLYIY